MFNVRNLKNVKPQNLKPQTSNLKPQTKVIFAPFMASAKKYTEYNALNMPAIEREYLARWKEEETFKKSVEERDGAVPFVFYEGPPSANGLPGIHHVISRTLKDL